MLAVEQGMTRPSATLLWIDAGATIFLVALLVSRLLVPHLRPRHFFQAAIYIAVVLLAHRGSAWGFGAGFAIGMVWNAFSLLVTHLMQAGLVGSGRCYTRDTGTGLCASSYS